MLRNLTLSLAHWQCNARKIFPQSSIFVRFIKVYLAFYCDTAFNLLSCSCMSDALIETKRLQLAYRNHSQGFISCILKLKHCFNAVLSTWQCSNWCPPQLQCSRTSERNVCGWNDISYYRPKETEADRISSAFKLLLQFVFIACLNFLLFLHRQFIILAAAIYPYFVPQLSSALFMHYMCDPILFSSYLYMEYLMWSCKLYADGLHILLVTVLF